MKSGDTSISEETSKEAPRQYNLRRNTKIRSHPHQIKNMLILTKKFKNLSRASLGFSLVDFKALGKGIGSV